MQMYLHFDRFVRVLIVSLVFWALWFILKADAHIGVHWSDHATIYSIALKEKNELFFVERLPIEPFEISR